MLLMGILLLVAAVVVVPKESKKSIQMAPKKKEKAAKAAAAETKPKAAKSPSSGLPWGGIAVAFLSLALGLVTPPLLHRAAEITPEPSRVFQQKTTSDATGSVPTTNEPDAVKRKLPESDDSKPVVAREETETSTTTLSLDACSEELLQQFWHDESMPGFHIVCFSGQLPLLEIVSYKDGLKQQRFEADLTLSTDQDGWPDLKEILADQLQLKPTSATGRQPWAIFSQQGARLVSETDTNRPDLASFAQEHGLVLLFEGGQFLWPGVRVGFERQVHLYAVMPEGSPDMGGRNQTVTLQTLSTNPLVLSVTGFLDEKECAHIQELALPTMEYSGVVLMDKDKGKESSEWRTSASTFVAATDDIMVDIDYRTASLVRIPRTHQEHVQVLRYEKTEKYDAHHDFFDPSLYQQDPNTLRLIKHGKRNRLATVFWYLTTVESGGETIFPRVNGAREKSFTDCEHGLKVKPIAGSVIIFYSMKADGSTDVNSLHGACPVKEGVKWAANKWVWNERMPYTPA